MRQRQPLSDDPLPEHLLTAAEVAELIGTSDRLVLALPIRRVRIGPRTIRFRLKDVYEFLGLDEPDVDRH